MTARGNITSVSQWVSGTTYITTTNAYNDLGDLLTSTDAGNHQTSFDYTDNYSDGTNHSTLALPTKVTYPQTGTIAHIVKMQYNWPTGLVSRSVDQNNQTTTYAYDSLLRPSSIGYPDGGQTIYSYRNTQQIEVQSLISGTSCPSSNCTDSWTVLMAWVARAAVRRPMAVSRAAHTIRLMCATVPRPYRHLPLIRIKAEAWVPQTGANSAVQEIQPFLIA